MHSRRRLVHNHFAGWSPFALLTATMVVTVAFQTTSLTHPLQDTVRTIVSDDFIKNRPSGKTRRRFPRQYPKTPGSGFSGGRSYRLASQSSPRPVAELSLTTESQVGLTFWKLRHSTSSESKIHKPLHQNTALGWIAERVEADTVFLPGNYLRLSIESPRAGYLYVIDRDWFSDGDLGETNLIFPIRGDDNRLQAGKLIDIPAPNQTPFKATPKANQLGEILTIIVTSSPLDLQISEHPLPISSAQLNDWEARWGGITRRFEMENGAGQMRTRYEEQAASRKGTRQLTRDDPPPQTIYVLTTKDRSALLFNVKLHYAR